jgi:hypothetical protein
MNGDLFSKSFDHLLAFVLPGLVVLWGYSYVDPNGLGAWFVTASTTNTSVGGFLFLLLAALGVGVFVSGVKSLVFERWFRLFPEPPPFDEKRRTESGVLEAYADARHNHYYYHLFYANMLCAAPVPSHVACQRPPWERRTPSTSLGSSTRSSRRTTSSIYPRTISTSG